MHGQNPGRMFTKFYVIWILSVHVPSASVPFPNFIILLSMFHSIELSSEDIKAIITLSYTKKSIIIESQRIYNSLISQKVISSKSTFFDVIRNKSLQVSMLLLFS